VRARAKNFFITLSFCSNITGLDQLNGRFAEKKKQLHNFKNHILFALKDQKLKKEKD